MTAASLAEGLLAPLEPLAEPESDRPESDRPEVEPPAFEGTLLAGRYSVETVLAEGGMGVVWLGRHVELDRPVAIKFLRRALSGKEAVVARFLNEARAAAALRSNHVVRVMDVGQLESGRPYLVMEHLDGIDLDALVERDGPQSVEVAVDYVLQVCEALTEAHGAGIVHRDIKPENLFLSHVGAAKPIVKVVDFGLAKRLDGAGAKVVTGPLENMGSPCYMSPEQIDTPRQVDERTDIWSLGVVLYRLLTGVLPFDGDSVAEVCAHVLNAAPAPVRAERPDLDAAIESIVARCLEKKPEDRYASIGELTNALERYVAGAVSATRPASVTQSSLRTLAPPKRRSEPPALEGPSAPLPGVRPLGVRSVVFALMFGAMVPLAAFGGVYLAERAGYRPRDLTDGWLTPRVLSKTAVAALSHDNVAPDFVPLLGAAPAGAATPRDVAPDSVAAPGAAIAAAEPPVATQHEPKHATRRQRERAPLRALVVQRPPKPESELTPEEIVRRKLAYEEYLASHGYKPIGEALRQMRADSAASGTAPAPERAPEGTKQDAPRP